MQYILCKSDLKYLIFLLQYFILLFCENFCLCHIIIHYLCPTESITVRNLFCSSFFIIFYYLHIDFIYIYYNKLFHQVPAICGVLIIFVFRSALFIVFKSSIPSVICSLTRNFCILSAKIILF